MNRIRFATLLFPPLGIGLMWRDGTMSFGRKILGTLTALLCTILHLAGIVFLLMQFPPLELE